MAAWLFGAIWYMALGSPWKAALGWTADQIKSTKPQMPVVPMIVSFIAECLMAAILALFMHAFARPSALQGAMVGAHFWLGVLVIEGAVLGLMG